MNINTMAEKQVDYKSYKLPIRLYPTKMRASDNEKLTYHAKTMFRNKVVMEDIAKDLIVTGILKNNSADDILFIWEKINAAIKDRILNGSLVDSGLGIMYAKVSGSFDSKLSEFNPALHTIDFGFRTTKELKELAASVTPVIAQGNEILPEILSVFDMESKLEGQLTPGGDVIIKGKNIMIAGENEDVGLYFTNDADGTETVVKAEKIIRNTGTEVICDIPELAAGTYTLSVKTQRSNKSPTKETLLGIYAKTLTVKA